MHINALNDNFVILDIERKKSKSVKKGDYSEVSRLCNIAGELLSTNGMAGRFDYFRFKSYPRIWAKLLRVTF